jgi:hypothetical protein
MTYQISEPVDIPHLQQILNALEAEIDERQLTTATLARKNAELYGELQRRLAESESFNRVLVSLLQKTVLDQVLDISNQARMARPATVCLTRHRTTTTSSSQMGERCLCR